MMNPNASSSKPLTTDQKDRLESVMKTTVTPSQPPKSPEPAPNPTTSPFATPNSLNATTVMPPVTLQPATQSTYAAPTVSLATTVTAASTSTSHPKAKSTAGPSNSLKIILFVLGGIVLLVVYTVIWAFIFNISIPGLPI